ncbi:MAG: 4-(cytidine 5'-diphospho)-2-C-methyl-D-erythritol kinase [Bacteroidota bacterium]
MIVFPNCKINLGLQILQKRGDGFHDIETIFYPIPLKDALEIVPAQNQEQQPTLCNYGTPVHGNATDNLCIKAWHLLKNDFPDLPAVQIHLLKNIPMGAGLGGGSADGACMLQMLNNKFHLELSSQQLIQYGLQLGSDCPFFIINKPCLATGRGEILEPLPVDLSAYQLVLANPGIHVNTGWAFAQLNVNDMLTASLVLRDIIMQPVESWRHFLQNDFEMPVFNKYPQLKAVKENLYALGAVYAAMSGSGSTVFGIFNDNISLAEALPVNYSRLKL